MTIKPTAEKPLREHKYATEIVGRYPKFKTHWNIGHAKNAVKNASWRARRRLYGGTWEWVYPDFYARVFELKHGEWVYVPELSLETTEGPDE